MHKAAPAFVGRVAAAAHTPTCQRDPEHFPFPAQASQVERWPMAVSLALLWEEEWRKAFCLQRNPEVLCIGLVGNKVTF